jgi:hypothetical protein
MIQVVEGLGWPEERQEKSPLEYFAGMADGEEYRSEEIVNDLEAWRDEYYPEWCRERGIFNLAILVAKGFFWRAI